MIKKPKGGPGRPSDYRPEYCALAQEACKRGATDSDLADIFRVSRMTITRWRLEHPEFCDATKVGKAHADDAMERSLYERGRGFHYEAEKVLQHEGGGVIVKYTEYVLPDVGAIRYWLSHRRPDEWSERSKLKLGIDPDSPFERFLRSFDGESRKLPPGNDPDDPDNAKQ